MATQKQLRRAVLIGGLLVCVGIVFSIGFSVYLGARLTIPVARRVPIGLGERFQLTFPAAKPYKVEVCSTERDCLTVAWRVQGPGLVELVFPKTAPVGHRMFLKVSERKANGKLGPVVRTLRQAFLVRAGAATAAPPAPSSSSGGSTGAGDGSAGGGGGSGGGGISVSNVRFTLDGLGGSSWLIICGWDTSTPSIVETFAQARANGGAWMTWHVAHDSTWWSAEGTPKLVTPHTRHGCPVERLDNRFRDGDVIEARIVGSGGEVLSGPRSVTAPSPQGYDQQVEF